MGLFRGARAGIILRHVPQIQKWRLLLSIRRVTASTSTIAVDMRRQW